MKKTAFSALLAALCLLMALPAAAQEQLRGYDKKAGYQYIAFGSFPQEADGTVHPILWRVLDVNDEYAYLLSEYVLFGNRIDPDDVYYQDIKGDFSKTEMFRLLNGPFDGDPIPLEEQKALNEKERLGYAYIAPTCFADTAFTDTEKAMLIEDEALGKVFLASADDLKNKDYGFTSSKARQAYGTAYAYETGLFEYQNHTSPYWTRSQSVSYKYATRCTKVDGDLGYIRCVVMNEGCRPAIRLSSEALTIAAGSGTMEDPFTLAR